MALYPVPQPPKRLHLLGSRLLGPALVSVSIAALAGVAMAAGVAKATSITMVATVTPVKATAVVQPALLGGKVSLTGVSRVSSRATASELKGLLGSAVSRASSTAQPGTLKSRLDTVTPARAAARVSAAFLGGKVALTSTGRSHGQAIGQLGTASTAFNMGTGLARASGLVQPGTLKSRLVGGISRCSSTALGKWVAKCQGTAVGQGRARATGILMVGKAAPSRAVGRATGTIRFQGSGTDIGGGVSRATGRAKVVSITMVAYATPIRTPGRVLSALSLYYGVEPARAHGFAKPAQLGFVGAPAVQYFSRASGRVLPAGLNTYQTTAPARGAGGRAFGVLQFAGGTTTSLTGLSRQSVRARGDLTMGGGLHFSLGVSKVMAHPRARALSLTEVYYSTPARVSPRARGQYAQYYGVAPVRGAVGRAFAPTFLPTAKQFMAGTARVSGRVAGAFLTIKPALTGTVRAPSRAIGSLPSSRLPLSGLSREVGRVYCAQLIVTAPVITTVTGTARVSSRVSPAQLHVYWAAQPAQGTARAGAALLTGKLSLTGTDRTSCRATGVLTFTGSTIQSLEGRSGCSTRVVGSLPRTFHVAAPIRCSGVVQPAVLTALTSQSGRAMAHPRAVAVLAFTGATVQPLVGAPACSTARAYGQLKAIFQTQPSRCSGIAVGQLSTRQDMTGGTAAAHPLATGAFANPYAMAVSCCSGGRATGIFVQSLPLEAAPSMGHGRLMAQLTIPAQLPRLTFMAKDRLFVFPAREGRGFVLVAKDRQFVFIALPDDGGSA